MTDTYHVAKDYDGDESLWRGEPRATDETKLATKEQ